MSEGSSNRQPALCVNVMPPILLMQFCSIYLASNALMPIRVCLNSSVYVFLPLWGWETMHINGLLFSSFMFFWSIHHKGPTIHTNHISSAAAYNPSPWEINSRLNQRNEINATELFCLSLRKGCPVLSLLERFSEHCCATCTLCVP